VGNALAKGFITLALKPKGDVITGDNPLQYYPAVLKRTDAIW
jgi:hypothetical protein